MSSNKRRAPMAPPFPVSREDKERTESPVPPVILGVYPNTPTPPSRSTPARDSSPFSSGKSEDFLSVSMENSRRPSLLTVDFDSRRGSVKTIGTDLVKDLRKGVGNVTDITKKAGSKVKDASQQIKGDMEATTKKMKDKTSHASHWVASQTSKKAKAAMEQARSKLSIGEKITLFGVEKISLLSKSGFTHVFMFLVLLGYTALGALMFMACEGSNESREIIDVVKARTAFIKDVWELSQNSTSFKGFTVDVENNITTLENQLYKSFNNGYYYQTELQWTFWKSMFFCSTITTTIGYGDMTPGTPLGKALVILYALIGIPLFLILLTDFGKLFTRALKHIFIFLRKVNRSDACVQFKKNKLYKRIAERLKAMKNFICFWNEDEDDSNVIYGPNGEVIDPYFQDGNFNIPISLALIILLVYVLIGTIIYPIWEKKWTYFDAFYFIFISMTTIGFGDLVPTHPAYMMLTTVYLVFGLSLTAMSINIIQEKLTGTFKQATLKIRTFMNNPNADYTDSEVGTNEDINEMYIVTLKDKK